jgi:hypothetical protein
LKAGRTFWQQRIEGKKPRYFRSALQPFSIGFFRTDVQLRLPAAPMRVASALSRAPPRILPLYVSLGTAPLAGFNAAGNFPDVKQWSIGSLVCPINRLPKVLGFVEEWIGSDVL